MPLCVCVWLSCPRCRVCACCCAQVLFQQWLLDGTTAEPLARADVTCLCLDAATGKMVAAPGELLGELKEWAARAEEGGA